MFGKNLAKISEGFGLALAGYDSGGISTAFAAADRGDRYAAGQALGLHEGHQRLTPLMEGRRATVPESMSDWLERMRR